MPDAFISYSLRDSRACVERLAAALEQRGALAEPVWRLPTAGLGSPQGVGFG